MKHGNKPGATDRPGAAPAAGAATTGSEVWPREQMVAVAAYYLAQRRGFAPDQELADWLKAEAEVDAMLGRLG